MALIEITITETEINKEFKEQVFHHLKFITEKLNHMANKEDVAQILADNAATKKGLANLAKDIKSLDDKIASAETPTDLSEIKADSASLRASVEALDALHPESPTIPPTEPPVIPPTEPPVVPPTEPPVVPPTEPTTP